MILRWTLLSLALLGLSACAGYTDRKSPCVCNWTPLAGTAVPA